MQLPTLEDLTTSAPQITKEHNKQKITLSKSPSSSQATQLLLFSKKIPRKTLKCICPKGTFYAL